MFPNGTGDFLSALNEQKILDRLRQKNILYLSVCSVNNIT
jgi:UDP-N-acetylglucosamine pyrophosphorylase